MKRLNDRFSQVLTGEDIKRINIKEKNGNIKIMVDVHGMTVKAAKRLINNIINMAMTVVEIVIIHGYNHGTAIKDMLLNRFENSHIDHIFSDEFNMGVTHIVAY